MDEKIEARQFLGKSRRHPTPAIAMRAAAFGIPSSNRSIPSFSIMPTAECNILILRSSGECGWLERHPGPDGRRHGIPGEVRFVNIPYFTMYALWTGPRPVLALESGVRYHTYCCEPESGIKIDLGGVERPSPGARSWRTPSRVTTPRPGWTTEQKSVGERGLTRFPS